MASLDDTLFGPLDTKYCIYFYILSVLGLILTIIAGITGMGVILSANKLNWSLVLGVLGYMIQCGIIYFVNRLLYNMCKTSEDKRHGR